MALKQQNLFNIQSKWSEFFKSTSCILGCIKILLLHFLAFFCVKMHDFCVNAIPVSPSRITGTTPKLPICQSVKGGEVKGPQPGHMKTSFLR